MEHPQERKKPWIETPLIESAAFSKAAGCRIFLKLELLQPSGSFKSRGVGNLILSSLTNPAHANKTVHFYSSSGGNAGLAAVVAARDLGCPCTVVVPLSTKPMMITKLLAVGATEVIQYGASWSEADAYLRENFIDTASNQEDGLCMDGQQQQQHQRSGVKNIYVPPFDHPEIWKGASTIVHEIVSQLPPVEGSGSASGSKPRFPADAIICSVGGGGLFNGVIQGLDEYLRSYRNFSQMENERKEKEEEKIPKPVHVVAVETYGTDSLALSLREGSLNSLPAITSLATCLGALRVAPQTFKNAQSPPAGVEVSSVVGTDAEAARGVVTLADETRLQVELACGICVDVALHKLKEVVKDLTPESRVVLVVCGGSAINAEMVAEYRQRLESGWE